LTVPVPVVMLSSQYVGFVFLAANSSPHSLLLSVAALSEFPPPSSPFPFRMSECLSYSLFFWADPKLLCRHKVSIHTNTCTHCLPMWRQPLSSRFDPFNPCQLPTRTESPCMDTLLGS
jgi:hypothetical protein